MSFGVRLSANILLFIAALALPAVAQDRTGGKLARQPLDSGRAAPRMASTKAPMAVPGRRAGQGAGTLIAKQETLS